MSSSVTPPISDWQEKPRPSLRMTEEEFVAWVDEDTHAEWVDGEVIFMAPISDEHDDLQWWLRSLLQFYVQRKGLGRVFGPQFTIRLNRRRRDPDVIFLGNDRLDRARKNHIEGACDLAIEVVSPDSVARDWREKYLEYEAGGVREYWVVDPLARKVEAYGLGRDGKYAAVVERDGKLPSAVVPGWYVRPAWLWEKRPDVLDALREMGS